MLIHENDFTTGQAMAYRGLLDLRQLKGNAICDLENNEIQEIVDIQDILRNDDFMNEATDKLRTGLMHQNSKVCLNNIKEICKMRVNYPMKFTKV